MRRQKTYSARSGYVYQYTYEGRRELARGVEHVFSVSADRKTFFDVRVFFGAGAVDGWESRHGRALHPNERYAVAKMSLFLAFDERDAPAALRRGIAVRPADAEAILEVLGID